VGVLAAVLARAPQAVAADFGIGSFFSQRFDVDDEGELGSATDLGVTFDFRGQRTEGQISPGLRLIATTDDEDEDSVRVRPSLAGRFITRGPRSRLSGNASVIPQTTRFTERVFVPGAGFEPPGGDDPGVDDPPDPDDEPSDPVSNDRRSGEAFEIAARARLGYDYTLSPISGLTTSGFINVREFDGGDFTSFVEVGATAGYRRRLDPRTGASFTFGLSQVDFDADTPDTVTARLRASANRRLTPTMSGNAGLGVSVTERDGDDSQLGIIGNAGIREIGRDTFWGLGFSQDVRPNADTGTVDSVSRINGSIGYRVDTRTSMVLGASAGFETPVFDSDDDDGGDLFVTLAPTLNHRLSEDWRLSVGYRYRAGDDGDFLSDASHNVFIRFARNFDLLP
jgi:hypothetical protein